jgi:ADP-ribosylglycohydrolase
MIERAEGAVIGALVGDAAGGVLEFFGREIEAADVEHAMTMPGGGCFRLAPGQVTDDGELTMSLLRALAERPDAPRSAAARRYAAWVASGPFDIGTTTVRSLGCLRHPRWGADRSRDVADLMTDAAGELCMDSKANGSLMRATPLGVWGATRTDEEAAAAAADDARLSHPNPACVGAARAYVVAIATLVRGGSPEEAFAAASRASSGEARAWLDEALAGVVVPYEPMMGFVRIGFTHAFRHLASGTTYTDALRETLAGGGDTDTNACIVGGLLGARWGVSAIPRGLREAVLSCDTTGGAHRRPPELLPRDAPALVRALIGA